MQTREPHDRQFSFASLDARQVVAVCMGCAFTARATATDQDEIARVTKAARHHTRQTKHKTQVTTSTTYGYSYRDPAPRTRQAAR